MIPCHFTRMSGVGNSVIVDLDRRLYHQPVRGNIMIPYKFECMSGVGDNVIIDVDKLTFQIETGDVYEIDCDDNITYLVGSAREADKPELALFDDLENGEVGIGCVFTSDVNNGTIGEIYHENVYVKAEAFSNMLLNIMALDGPQPMAAKLYKLYIKLVAKRQEAIDSGVSVGQQVRLDDDVIITDDIVPCDKLAIQCTQDEEDSLVFSGQQAIMKSGDSQLAAVNIYTAEKISVFDDAGSDDNVIIRITDGAANSHHIYCAADDLRKAVTYSAVHATFREHILKQLNELEGL